MNRIVGLETEYGCLTTLPSGSAGAVSRIRDWIFTQQRFGLMDVHQRDWDEPPGNGGFLFNGGRIYIDMGHLEYCTPECLSLLDVLRYDHAGDALVMQAVKGLRLAEEVSFIRNNIDHYTNSTFGCHENYLVRRAAPLTETNVMSLIAFLTLRVLYTGAGRVGSSGPTELRGVMARPGADGLFQISQRADHITNDLYEWVQFNRAIINTRDEPLGDPRKFRRLHLLHGDTNVLPTTLLLKTGTTALALDLLEIDRLPKIALADAVKSFRELSHRAEGPWLVAMADGHCADAVEILWRFHEAAHSEFRGRDAETDGLLKIWRSTLTALGSEPEALVGRIDWITKRWLFRQFLQQESISWTDPWLKAQDLEYHHVDPERSLGLALDQSPADWKPSVKSFGEAVFHPPENTRAHARSQVMQWLRVQTRRYFLDWEIVVVEGGHTLNLLNPFDPAPVEAERWQNALDGSG